MARTIAVVNQKGGVGKTTSVVELAFLSGHKGMKTLVVDLDAQANATRQLRRREQTQTLSLFDLMTDTANRVSLRDVIQLASEDWENVALIPADFRLGTIDPHLQSRLQKESILARTLAPIDNLFDLVLLDLGPTINILTINALAAANQFLIPTDLSEFSRDGLTEVLNLGKQIRDAGINSELSCLGIFITSYQAGIQSKTAAVSGLVDDLYKDYPNLMLDVRIPDSPNALKAQRAGSPICKVSPNSTIAKAYINLFTEVVSSDADHSTNATSEELSRVNEYSNTEHDGVGIHQ